MSSKEKFDKVCELTEKELATFLFNHKKQEYLQAAVDLVSVSCKVPPLFWQHINNKDWEECIEDILTPTQIQLIEECPEDRKVVISVLNGNSRKINHVKFFKWFKKWSMVEINESDFCDGYAAAQREMHDNLMFIINTFNINIDKAGRDYGKCVFMEAQINYPKAMYRQSLQMLSYNKMGCGAYQKNYKAVKSYIAHYLPLAQNYKKLHSIDEFNRV